MTNTRQEAMSAFKRLAERAVTSDVQANAFVVELASPSLDFVYFGSSVAGEPCLIVVAAPSHTPPPPLRLAGLTVDYGVRSVLSDATQEMTVRVSVIRCTAAENASIEVFAALSAGFIEGLAARPTEHELANELARWSGLFWRLAQRVDTDIVGLAGELVTLRSGHDADRWVRAWHKNPNELIDFEFEDAGVTVEVKATRGNTRVHQISLAQLDVAQEEQRFIASVLVDFGDGGVPIGDLVRELLDRLSDDRLRVAFWDVLARSCGSGLEDVLARRLHVTKAAASLAFFRANDVPAPRVELPLPVGVSSVKFMSDLTTIEARPNPEPQ